MEHIGLKIKQLCKEKKVSVEQLSESLNISRQGVYDIFKRSDVKSHQLKIIADILQVSTFDITNESKINVKSFFNSSDEGILKRLTEINERQAITIQNLSDALSKLSGVRAKFKMYTRAS